MIKVKTNRPIIRIHALGKEIKKVLYGSILIWPDKSSLKQSCFGNGWWDNKLGWINEDGWKN